MRRLVADLNAAYRSLPALHERDCEPEGFEWIIGNDHSNSVLAWIRKAPDADPVLVISNFTPVPRSGYKVPLPKAGRWVERINTDAGWYSGGNTGNQGGVVAKAVEGQHWPAEAEVFLPPLATLFLKYEPD
jgi:1,4-alpha-glucan branching enzyme